jgi:hypothetical protein
VKRFLRAMSAAAVMVALVSSMALAAPATFTQATGSVWLSGPTQYVAFNAFDYGATGDRGTVNYTNFEYAAPGSGAWLPVAGTYALTTAVDGSPYSHTMIIDTVTVISPTNVTFSGTGFFNADHAYTWTVTGSIVNGTVSFHILYTGTNAGYFFDATGPAAAMAGTGTDSNLTPNETWSISPAFAHEVLSFTASVTCAVVTSATSTATFVFTIPAGFPSLSGLPIVIKVLDGGTPGTNGDVYGHGVATSACDGPVGNYPITGGNLVVH